jgi:putative ABC transport system substrate-binding protein
MDRRRFLLTSVAGVLAAPLGAEAQPTGTVYRIGYLTPWPLGQVEEESFWRGLRNLGYVKGQNIIAESRTAQGDHDRVPKLAAELVAAKVHIVVAATGMAALAVKSVTSTIPIVIAASADAEAQGIVLSIRRPGSNVTGLTALTPQLGAKRFEILKQMLPHLKQTTALCARICHSIARKLATSPQPRNV